MQTTALWLNSPVNDICGYHSLGGYRGDAPMGIRVFQLASESGLSSAEVVARCAELAIAATNHMSILSEEEAARVRSAIGKKILKKALEKESMPRQARAAVTGERYG